MSRIVHFDPLSFALACVTTGGPATIVTWQKNGYVFPRYTQNQNVTDYEEATYINEVTVSSSTIAGSYIFHVSNAVSSATSRLSVLSGKHT